MTASEFVKTLTVKQRDALNILLRNPTAVQDIALMCGAKTLKPLSENERRTELARTARTAELFQRETL